MLHPFKKGVGYLAALAALACAGGTAHAGGTISIEPITQPDINGGTAVFALNYESETDAIVSGCQFKLYYKSSQVQAPTVGDGLANTTHQPAAEQDADTGAPADFDKYKILQMDAVPALTDNDAGEDDHQYTLAEITFETQSTWGGQIDLSIQPIQAEHPDDDPPIYSIDLDANNGVPNGEISYDVDSPAYALPNITALTPEGTYLDAPDFTLTVTGTEFYDNEDSELPDSTIKWGGTDLLGGTNFDSATKLTGLVTTEELPDSEGVINVTVNNGAGHGTSAEFPFYVVDRDEVYVDDDWADDGYQPGDIVDNNTDRIFGANAFAKIQDAVNAVNPGKRVVVYNGEYVESDIIIANPMTIDGESRNGVVVKPAVADDHQDGIDMLFDQDSHSAFIVAANNVKIQDLTIDGNNDFNTVDTNDDIADGFRGGIVTKSDTETRNGLELTNLTIQNVWRVGVYIDGKDAELSINNKLNDVDVNNVVGAETAQAILLIQADADVTLSNIENCIEGIATNYADNNVAAAGTVNLTKNTISGTQIAMNLGGLAGNSIIGGSLADKNDIDVSGVALGAIIHGAVGSVDFSHNTIDAAGAASAVWLHNNGPANVEVASNILNGNSSTAANLGEGTAIFMFADADLVNGTGYYASEAALSGNIVTGFGKGVHVYNTSSNVSDSVIANLNTTANQITSCGTGLFVEGKYAKAELGTDSAIISGGDYGIDVATGTADIDGITISDNDTGIIVRDGGEADINNNTLTGNTAHFAFEAGAATDSRVNGIEQDREVTDLLSVIAQNTSVAGKTYVAQGYNNTKTGQLQLENDNFVRLRSRIQDSVTVASPTNTVQVLDGKYIEEVKVEKTIALRGNGVTGAEKTTISGPMGGATSHAVYLTADDIVFENFIVSREGNNSTDWNNSLSAYGVSIVNSSRIKVRNNYITGCRNGVYMENVLDTEVFQNDIDFNRTGMHLVNNVSGSKIEQNFITDNWTMGILFRNETAAQTTHLTIENNNISGNWYSQVDSRWDSPAILDLSGNWFGPGAITVTQAGSGEEGYSTQIPSDFGGDDNAPGNAVTIAGSASANIDFNGWLNIDTDTGTAMGFQGDFRHLHLSSRSPIAAGHKSWIQDGVNLLKEYATPSGSNQLEMHNTGIVYTEAGAVVDTPCTIFGQGAREVVLNPPTSAINTGVAIQIESDDVTVENLTISGLDKDNRYASAILRPNGGITYDETVLQNLSIAFAGGDPRGAIELGQADALPLSAGNVVENCDLSNCGFAGIMTWAGSTTIHNNRFNGMSYTGLYIRPSTTSGGIDPYVEVTKNTVENAFVGARILAVDPTSKIGDSVNGHTGDDANTFKLGFNFNDIRYPSVGVSVEWGPCSITGNKFVADGTVLEGTGGSAAVYVWNTSSDATIANNHFSGNGTEARAITAAGQRTVLGSGDATTKISVQGNLIEGYGTGVHIGYADTSARAVTATIGGTASNHIHNCVNGILVDGLYASATIANNNATIDGGNVENSIGIDVAAGTADLDNNTIVNNDTGIRVRDGGTIQADDNTLEGNKKHLAFEVTASGDAKANTHNMNDKSAADLEEIAEANSIEGRTYLTLTKVLSDNLVEETVGAEKYTHLRSTIQGSVDVTEALNNTVNAMAGTFVENINVAKALRINGAGDGRTVTADLTLIYPADSDLPGMNELRPFGGSQVIVVEARDVEISNLKIDGDNPELGDDESIDAQNGISVNAVSPRVNNLHIHGCTIENVYLCGINADDVLTHTNAYHIHHNIIRNANSTADSSAIYAHYGRGVIENNVITNGRIHTLYCGGTLQNNTISNGSIIAHNNDANLAILNNSVDDSPLGIHIYSMENATLVSGNTLENVATGILVEGSKALITVNRNEVSAGTKAGIGTISLHVQDLELLTDKGLYTEGVIATANNNIFQGAETGIKLERITAHDVVADGTNNSIEGGLACVDTDATKYNFSGNYWNLDGAAADATSVKALITGDHVDFTPWIVSGDDQDSDTNTIGFLGDHSVLHVAASTHSDQVGSVSRFQEAVNLLEDGDAATAALKNRTIRAYAGTYEEDGVAVNKQAIITGIDENTVILNPSVAASSPIAFDVQSDDVTISNMTIAGLSDAAADRYTHAIRRADTAMYHRTKVDNVNITFAGVWPNAAILLAQPNISDRSVENEVKNCVFTSCGRAGVEVMSGETDFLNNTFNNMTYAGLYIRPSHENSAVSHALVDVKQCTFSNSWIGIRANIVDPLSIIGSETDDDGNENTFNLGFASIIGSHGISVEHGACRVMNNIFNATNGFASVGVHVWRSADPALISGNEFNGTDKNSPAVAIKVVGERQAPLAGTSDNDAKSEYKSYATIEKNEIAGFGIGVLLGQADTADREVIATVGGVGSAASNTIQNCGKAVHADGAFATVAVSNNSTSFYGNTVGIEVSNGAEADIDANSIYANATGIKVSTNGTADIDGNDFVAVSPGTFNNDDIELTSDAGTVAIGDHTANKFHANDQYIVNASAQNIDVRTNLFNNDDPATLDVSDAGERADLWDLENKLTHKINNNAYGFLRVKENEVFVTNDKKGEDSEAPGIGVIERGVLATAAAGETVNVQKGTYNEGVDIAGRFVELYSADGIGEATIDNTAKTYGVKVVMSNGSGNVIINGFDITGDNAAGIDIDARAQAASGSSFGIENCLIYGLPTGGAAITVEKAKLGMITCCTITDSDKGVMLNNSKNVTIEKSRFARNRATALEITKREVDGAGTGVAAEGIIVDRCTIVDTGMVAGAIYKESYGIYMGSYPNGSVHPFAPGVLGRNNQITNCEIINNGGTGIWVQGQNMNVMGTPEVLETGKTIIKGNIIEGNGRYTGGLPLPNTEANIANTDGIKVKTSANTEIVGNVITKNIRNGILVDSNAGKINGGFGTKINNNHINDNVDQIRTTGSPVGAGLMLQLAGNPDMEIDANANWWGHVYGPDHLSNTQAANRGSKILDVAKGGSYKGIAKFATNWYGYRAPGQLAYALNDRDGDGILDAYEDVSPILVDPLTNPNTNLNGVQDAGTTETVRHSRHSDTDGIEDGVEVKLGFDPNDATKFPVAANFPWTIDTEDGDFDNDDYLDMYEYAVGSDPTDPASIPNLGNVNNNDNSVPDASDVSDFREVLVGTKAFTAADVYQDHMDTNRDGVITNADVIGLRRYVELGAGVQKLPTK